MKYRIYGIGTDILELERIKRILEQDKNDRFLHRVLTKKELDLYKKKNRNKIAFVGGRFAAKEAVVKALGTGIGEKVGLQDIEILPDSNGKPVCLLSQQAKHHLQLTNYNIHITISHSDAYATATAVVELMEN